MTAHLSRCGPTLRMLLPPRSPDRVEIHNASQFHCKMRATRPGAMGTHTHRVWNSARDPNRREPGTRQDAVVRFCAALAESVSDRRRKVQQNRKKE